MTVFIILCIAMLNIACLLISKRKSIKWRFFLNGISLLTITFGLWYAKVYGFKPVRAPQPAEQSFSISRQQKKLVDTIPKLQSKKEAAISSCSFFTIPYVVRDRRLFTATTAKRGNSPIDRGILTFIFVR